MSEVNVTPVEATEETATSGYASVSEVPAEVTPATPVENDAETTEATQSEGGDAPAVDPAVEGNILYKKYGLDELDQYMDSIADLSYLELVSLRNNMQGNIERIQACNSAMKELERMASKLNVAAAQANCLDHYGIDLNPQEFEEMYNLYVPKLEEIIKKCQMSIDGIGPRANSTKYINGNMILVLEKRLFSLDNTNPENASKILELTTTIDAYKNRTDFTWLQKKLTNMVVNKKLLRLMAKTLEKGTAADVYGELAKLFPAVTLGSFALYLEGAIGKGPMKEFAGYDRRDIIALLYCMNRILDVKVKPGEETWVKVFILNISDIMGGIYDLRMSAEELGNLANDMLEPIIGAIHEYLYDVRNIKISSQISNFHAQLCAKYTESVEAEEKRKRQLEAQQAEEERILAEMAAKKAEEESSTDGSDEDPAASENPDASPETASPDEGSTPEESEETDPDPEEENNDNPVKEEAPAKGDSCCDCGCDCCTPAE